MIHALLTLPLLTGCALPALPALPVPQAAPSDAAPDVGPFAFDPAREDLALESPEPGGATTIGALTEAYARCTGHVILFEPVVADSWRDAPVPAMTIPAARVQERVEQLLTLYGLTMRLQPGTSPRTVLIGTIEQPVGPAPFVELEALRSAGHHPAVPVATTVTVAHLDARQFVNSTRALLPDRSLQLIATGTNAVTLVGRAPGVLALADLVESADVPARESVVPEPSTAVDPTPAVEVAEGEEQSGPKPVVAPEFTITVLALAHHGAVELVDVLMPVLEVAAAAAHPEYHGRPCRITADLRSNSIVVVLPKDLVPLAKEVVAELDRPAGDSR